MESNTATLPVLRTQSDCVYSYLVIPITPVEHHGTHLRFRARLRRKDGTSRVHDVIVENMIHCPDLVERVWHTLERGNARLLVSFQRDFIHDRADQNVRHINVVAFVEGFPRHLNQDASAPVQLPLPL